MASISAVEGVEPSSAMMESPNWLDMPHELMVDILLRLRTVEILKSAPKVCTTWRTICKDPTMWKVIDVSRWQDGCDTDYNLEMLTKQAVDLSCGELTDVTINVYCIDDLLDYIVQRGSINNEDTEAIGRNCPQLKSFMVNWMSIRPFIECDGHAVAIAKSMPNLRHLRIFCNKMTNVGLQAILNGCPHLESLQIYMRYSLILDGNLVNKCMARIKNFIQNRNYFDEFSLEDY